MESLGHKGLFRFRAALAAVMTASLILVAVIWGHTFWKSRHEWRSGVDAQQAGKREEATFHFQKAILWYAPGNPYVLLSAEAIWKLSEEAEGVGQKEEALNGYRALRSALYASRSVYVPRKSWISRCDRKIARLMAQQETPILSEKGKTEEERYRNRLALLQAPLRPLEPWAAMAVGGFAGWVMAAVGFILQGLKPIGGFQGRHAAAWAGLFFVCYAVWLIGMRMA